MKRLMFALRAGWEAARRHPAASPYAFHTGIEVAFLAVAAIGAAASAYGSYAQAQQQKANLKAEAKILEADAAATRASGEAAAARQRAKDRALLDSFGSRAAGAGVVAREGSPLLSELDFAADSELEAQHVRYGFELDARSKNIRAGFARSRASQINPAAEAGLSLLQSGSSIAGSYYGSRLPARPQTGGGLRPRTSQIMEP